MVDGPRADLKKGDIMKTIRMTNGNNDASGETKASTTAGYWTAAKRIWPYVGMTNLKICVYDDSITDGDRCVYEGKQIIY
jgi:hypothetical protein